MLKLRRRRGLFGRTSSPAHSEHVFGIGWADLAAPTSSTLTLNSAVALARSNRAMFQMCKHSGDAAWKFHEKYFHYVDEILKFFWYSLPYVPAEKPAREKRDKAMEERKNSTTIEMSYACCLEFCFLCSTFLSRLHRCELELELLRLEKEEKQNSICAKKSDLSRWVITKRY